jgi:hypothetical protein
MATDKERLKEIRERLKQIRREWGWKRGDTDDVSWLLDQVDALGRAVAKVPEWNGEIRDDYWYCPCCDAYMQHEDGCAWVWAKAVYGEPDAAGEGESSG